MKITIIGSGAWQGIPAPFCSCIICTEATKNPNGKNYRTRPQLLIETAGGTFLLEVSPDIRLQSAKFQLPQVKDFVVSHWHFDHMYGLHELLTWMKKQAIKPTLYGSQGTKDKVDAEFKYLPMNVRVIHPYEKFSLFDVSITALPTYHMFNSDNNLKGNVLANTFGYLLEHNDKRVAYMADYYRLPVQTQKAIQGVDVLIADGTYLQTQDYEKEKPNHLHGKNILKFTGNTGAKHIYFHSISHLTKKTHEQMQMDLPANHFISYDGLGIELDN